MNRAAIFGAATFALMLTGTSAIADDSEQSPFYVQASVGFNYWDLPALNGYSWTAFRPEIDAGFHVNGRHDGLTFGVMQMFAINAVQGRASGGSFVRGGYDLAFKVGNFELNVDPYAFVGIGYMFDGLDVFFKSGPSAGIGGGGGVDVKMFFNKGFYAFVRPVELGFQCFEDRAQCAFQFAGAVGAGFAFGK